MLFQLTEAQRSILKPACSRDGLCIFPIIAPLKGGAVGNVCKSLLKRGLIEEVPATDEQTVWRHGVEGPLTLSATGAGQRAVTGEAAGEGAAMDLAAPAEPTKAPALKTTRQDMLLQLLRRKEGATMAEMSEATGWQTHSVRGALSGVIGKKLGLKVVSDKLPERGRVYRMK